MDEVSGSESRITRIAQIWRDTSISKKLYLVVGIMAILLVGELVTLRFAMGKLSAVRAFIGGEGLWSKAQKNAVYQLERYSVTKDERDYQAFIEALSIPDGDRRARTELEKANPDLRIVREGFLQGRIHPDDIDPMISLLRGFSNVSYISEAVNAWKTADEHLVQLRMLANEYRVLSSSPRANSVRVREISSQINGLNHELTRLEARFSEVLGEGSRWLERVVFLLLFFAVLTVEFVGLTLTFFTSRGISRGLRDLNDVAGRIGRGDFSRKLEVKSVDEIGLLTKSVNHMGGLLDQSYRELRNSHLDLEEKVRARTSELEQLAAENASLYEEAKAAIKMRDEFLSIASHELRTPLAALDMHVQMLARAVKPEIGQPDLHRVRQLSENTIRLSRRLSSLQEELMDLTRIRVGKLELKRERCDLVAIVCEATSQVSSESARVGSVVSIHADNPVFGPFDSTRIGQVVTNLLSNAIKYGEGKPIDVTAHAENDRAVIIVRDNGPGIPVDKHTQIFERFERVTNDESVQGLGLGLYISKQIVEAHGGSLTVASRPGQGAEFRAEFKIS